MNENTDSELTTEDDQALDNILMVLGMGIADHFMAMTGVGPDEAITRLMVVDPEAESLRHAATLANLLFKREPDAPSEAVLSVATEVVAARLAVEYLTDALDDPEQAEERDENSLRLLDLQARLLADFGDAFGEVTGQ